MEATQFKAQLFDQLEFAMLAGVEESNAVGEQKDRVIETVKSFITSCRENFSAEEVLVNMGSAQDILNLFNEYAKFKFSGQAAH